MPREEEHPPTTAPTTTKPETESERIARNVDVVRNQVRLHMALARARKRIREAQARGEPPRPELLARMEIMRQEYTETSQELARARGKPWRPSQQP